jgi:iron complex transport system ATP-binding protein
VPVLIKAKGLGFSYNGAPALAGADFELLRSEILAVIGPNGAGKSTLLGLMSGILKPGSGTVELLGKEISSYQKPELARLMAYVPSEFYIPYDFPVIEIVLMGRSPHVAWWRNYSDADSACAIEALRTVGILELKGRSINSLSSGERQLAFLAQALVQEPKVLLLDEPTSHLDINYKMRIFDLLTGRAAGGLGVAVVSHDLALLASYAGKALVLKKGGQVFHGPAKEGLSCANIASAYAIGAPASIERLLKIC